MNVAASALGVIEFKSVAKGIFVTDIMAKKAPVQILKSLPISPGKFLIIIAGEVACVDEAMCSGIQYASEMLVNKLFLPQPHHSLIAAISGTLRTERFDSIGIIEAFSVCSCIVAADIAAKASDIEIVEMRLAKGLGGKAYFIFTGDLANVEISMVAAKNHVDSEGMLTACEIIGAPFENVITKSLYW